MSAVNEQRLHATLASPTRRGMLAVVEAASREGGGVDAATIAVRLDLHVSTVRFHLEQLESVGLVWRVPSVEQRRGRPRVLFAADARPGRREAAGTVSAGTSVVPGTSVPPGTAVGTSTSVGTSTAVDASTAADAGTPVDAGTLVASNAEADAAQRSQVELIRVLAGALAARADHDGDRGRAAAIDAGRAWGRGRTNPRMSQEARADELVRTLDALGFAPERQEDEVLLHACPFRDAARQHPDVVCGAHLGLIRELMADRDTEGDNEHDAHRDAEGDAHSDRDGDGDRDAARDADRNTARDADSDNIVRLQPMAQPNLCVVSLGRARTAGTWPPDEAPPASAVRRTRATRGSGAA